MILPWCRSYNFIDIRHPINMCRLLLCFSNDSVKCEWKGVEETKDTDRNIGNTKETQKNNKEENFNLKARYCFLEFSYKHSSRNSWDLPNSCFNYLVNPQTLNDAPRTFFKRWLVSHSNFRITFSCL